jgi:hypothetical protein
VAGIGGILGIITLTVPSTRIPNSLWLSLFVGGLFIAQFLVFSDVRKERDAARGEIDHRFNSVRYRFQMTGLEGGPINEPLTGFLFSLRFTNGGIEVLEYEIESIEIRVGKHGPAPNSYYESKGGLILPGQEQIFRYPLIPAPVTPPGPRPMEGEYSILYGHPSGGQRFRTHHKFRITWPPNIAGLPIADFGTVGKVTHEPIEKHEPEGSNS